MSVKDETNKPVGGSEVAGDDSEQQKGFDHDGCWKDLIEKYCYGIFERAVPELFRDVDTSKKPQFLDKEFRDILNTADPKIHTSPHFADYLLGVPLKNGGMERVIAHFEAQGRGGGNLAGRMNHYRCLIVGHYREEPVGIAIITDGHKKEKKYYSHSRYGTKVLYEYNNLILAELDDKELLKSDNPVDLALYAAKQAARSKKDSQKYCCLRNLAELLAERGWSVEKKRNLMLFIERILYLKDDVLAKQYKEYRQQLAEEGKMMYIPFYERKEAEELVQRKSEEIAKNLLEYGVSPDVIAKSSGLPLDKIQSLMN